MATTLVVGFSRPVAQVDAIDSMQATAVGVEPLAFMSLDSAFSSLAEARNPAATLKSDVTSGMTAAGHRILGPVGDSLSIELPQSANFVSIISREMSSQSDTGIPVIVRAQRRGSFADEPVLQPVLGLVSHRLWVPVSRYSPDRAREDLRSRTPGLFHGVGFPNILRKNETARTGSSDSSPRANWTSMIAWRPSANDDTTSEPIADVRCMGLSPQAVARRADRYEQLILEAAVESGVSVSLVKAIVTKESCFDSEALSSVGAQGLMQLMPDTATWLKVNDPLDPEENLRAGVRYIASLREQFGTLDLALAAYNAGPGNVRRYKGVPPFAETQGYVYSVKANYRRYVAATNLATNLAAR